MFDALMLKTPDLQGLRTAVSVIEKLTPKRAAEKRTLELGM